MFEWILADFGIQAAAAVSVPILPSPLLPYPFPEENNEPTPTLKPKPRVIMRCYVRVVDAMYEVARAAQASQVVHTGG